MSGWHTSDRKARLPSDWTARRIRVLRRDGYSCQAKDSTGHRCGHPANQVDHIVLGDDYDNLQALCRWHHARKSSSEGGTAAAARRPRNAATPEAHPAFRSS